MSLRWRWWWWWRLLFISIYSLVVIAGISMMDFSFSQYVCVCAPFVIHRTRKMRFLWIWKSCTRHAWRWSCYWLLCYSKPRNIFFAIIRLPLLTGCSFLPLVFHYTTKSLLVFFRLGFHLVIAVLCRLLFISMRELRRRKHSQIETDYRYFGCIVVDVLKRLFAAFPLSLAQQQPIIGLNLFNLYA